ncbi:von Willebrand factor C and EGF domain-containing protein-like [Stegodyphus dumicola]|uniref:von Willebrand factor C and EGF domain-containing protein-like n=1 Tax=Stegodyphus dumicola TaxID=202533 RepID=UPI0015A8E197|nr:von Willebrand factor C and EGF domain-containing protein-like [Stegodyphus dumicola]
MGRRCYFWIFALLQITCAVSNSCDWRYYLYYKEKNCIPILGNDGCPVKFRCSPILEDIRLMCFHGGKYYAPGDYLQDIGSCATCECHNHQNGAYVSCSKDVCSDSLVMRNQSCYAYYKPGSCCPEENCPRLDDSDSITGCTYMGVSYKFGDIMKTKDPCKVCICSEQWSNEDECQNINCLEPIYGFHIRNGCLLIFQEDVCCFISIYCGTIYTKDPKVPITSNTEDLCLYGGEYYERGTVAFLNDDPEQLTTCTCKVPPDFTCVRKAFYRNQ